MSCDPPLPLALCPCGSGQPYPACCQPLHQGRRDAGTALELMRSRYSAYCQERIGYLIATTHPDKQRPELAQEIAAWAARVEFLRLEILTCQQGEENDRLGKVEFIAHYRQLGGGGRYRTASRAFPFSSLSQPLGLPGWRDQLSAGAKRREPPSLRRRLSLFWSCCAASPRGILCRPEFQPV